jgi:hypothetical protein
MAIASISNISNMYMKCQQIYCTYSRHLNKCCLKKGDGQVHLRNNDINIAMNRKKNQSTEIPTSFGKRTKKEMMTFR